MYHINTKNISSFDEYVKHTEHYKGRYYFRGQADATWDIIPSLFRGETVTLETERQIIHKKLLQNPKMTPLGALFHAQHYGLPTRICDLTISPLCALFFASDGDTDGVIYVIDRSKTVTTAGYEMSLFTTVLTQKIDKISELSYDNALVSPKDVLSKNYVVDARDFNFSNNRAFRQGGTGIVFGYDTANDEIKPIGKELIFDLIVEKIIIPASVKRDNSDNLRRLGYSLDILLNDPREDCAPEKAILTATKFKVDSRFDTRQFNKVTAEYRVSTLYFDRDMLSLQIDELYKGLFKKYGTNARIWLFFYYDDNDRTNANWICRGEWPHADGHEIKWNKDYRDLRLNYMNEQVSRDEAITRFSTLATKIEPFYDLVYSYISCGDYDVLGLFTLVKSIQADVRKIWFAAGDIPRSDVITESFTEAAYIFISNIAWIVDDMVIYANRGEQSDQSIRWMVSKIYIPECEASKLAYLQRAENYK